MILDSNATSILERYKAAKAAENEAITALHSSLASGVKDRKLLMELTTRMEAAHNASMAIHDELNGVRLDK